QVPGHDDVDLAGVDHRQHGIPLRPLLASRGGDAVVGAMVHDSPASGVSEGSARLLLALHAGLLAGPVEGYPGVDHCALGHQGSVHERNQWSHGAVNCSASQVVPTEIGPDLE